MLQASTQNELLHTFKFTPEEREIFRKKEFLPASEWAPLNREVTIGAHVGPWRNDISPHLNFIMDTASLPHVREITICKAPQAGGTEAVYNCIGAEITYSPCPVLIVMPTQADARKVSEDRIIPMLRKSRGLREFISDNPDDTAKQRIKLNNGAALYMGWYNSPSSLATFPIRIVVNDEKDKAPLQLKREASSSDLTSKRVRTYPYTSKIFNISSPTRVDGPIWQDLQNSDVIYNFFACCPECNHGQVFNDDQLIYPEDKTPQEIKREKLANYACAECGVLWTELDKNLAMRRGQWRAVKGTDVEFPIAPGFHLPAWVSLDVSLSEIAAAHLEAKSNKIKSIDYYNDYRAEPFLDLTEGEGGDADILLERCYDYGPKDQSWEVPMRACFVTVGVDMQVNRFEVEVIAWGPGFESWGIKTLVFPFTPGSHKIRRGQPGSAWNNLYKFWKEAKFKHESGVDLPIASMAVDASAYSTEVYQFTRPLLSRRVFAVKGLSTRGKDLYRISRPKQGTKGKRVMDAQAATLVNVGTEIAKDTLLLFMNTTEQGPGFMHYHKRYSLDYFRQLTAEHLVKKNTAGRDFLKWEPIHKGAPNEALDIRVYSYVMAEMYNAYNSFELLAENIEAKAREMEADKDRPSIETKEEKPKKKTTTKRRGKGFVNDY